MRLAPISALGLLLGVAGCSGGKPATATALAAEPLASIEIRPERSPLERQLDGTIEAVNQGTVAAQTSGRVAEILYDVNDFVPAGAVIVRLRATEQRTGLLQAEASLREAQARAIEAQTQFERVADIYARKVVPKATFDAATAARDAANARLTAAQAAVQAAREGVSYTEIRAPYAGIVTRRHVELGETVNPGTLLMSGLSLQYLRVAVDVPQSIVEQVRRIRKAAVYVGERRIEAQKLTVFPEASAPSNTFRARIELPENAADLYPGMFVKVGFVVGEADRLLVPAGALVQRGEVNAVYLIATDGSTTLRQVRVGHRFGERVEILAGLVAGDRVALDPVAATRRLEPAS
ncbi:MAG TPA: efflux RND transporter periplasmic adaptor subunit [Steroidobacteraceae bacterium]|nr:efflux RND transporter periplasmic adaptor subunit [Steroidobacteraceae bacterium]